MKTQTLGVMKRYGLFLLCNVPGTVIDLTVVWLLSRFLFASYWGQYVLAPAISYEFAIISDFTFSYFFVWSERVGRRTVGSYLKRLVAYNCSAAGAWAGKIAVIAFLGWVTSQRLGVVWCDAAAMLFSGTFNFVMNECLIFRKKKQ